MSVMFLDIQKQKKRRRRRRRRKKKKRADKEGEKYREEE